MRIGVFFFFLFLRSVALADFIDEAQAEQCETILEVFIGEKAILVRMEIGAQDYQWFSHVIPNKYYQEGFGVEDKRQRWAKFVKEQFRLSSGNRALSGEVSIAERRNKTPRSDLNIGLSDSSSLGEQIIFVEIFYPIHEKIKSLSIVPPLAAGQKITSANIGFVLYHKAIPVNDLIFLNTQETVHLDWEDPWYSYFENKNISRHHSSSFMSFLYVEPYEVRHEILGRIKDFEGWLDFEYKIGDMIPVEDQQEIRQRVADFLVSRNVVSIDGVKENPIVDRIHFVEVQLSGIQILEIPKPIPYSSAILGIIFAYPHESMPKEVTVHWDMFNEKIQKVPAISIDPAGPWPYDLQPSDSILKWTNFLKHYKIPTVTEQKIENASIDIPLFTVIFLSMIIFMLYRSGWSLNRFSKWRKFYFALFVILGVIALPVGYNMKIPFLQKRSYSAPEAKELVSQLLKNTYRAFDFRNEEDVYDKLAMCNDVDLLQKIYLETRRSMVVEDQGGVEAKVDEVLVTKVDKEPSDKGLAFRSGWIVKGVVGHWGHKHRRVNQYDAIIKIKPVNGVWKMFELDVIEEIRL